MRRLPHVLALAFLALLLATGSGALLPTPPAQAAGSGLRVTRYVTGLTQPWDVKVAPGLGLLVTERDTRHLMLFRRGHLTRVAFPTSSVWVSSETGLMSLEIDPNFAVNRRFYTCQGGNVAGGGHDVRVVAWRIDAAGTRATLIRTLLSGIRASTGRHGGCRLLLIRDGSMFVGTGDAAVSGNAQSRATLGGKTLRMNRITGAPWPTNPYAGAADVRSRYVFTYGHRNVQGLAQRRDGVVFSVEHGPDRDDEVNRLSSGGNYGWAPGPGYDESVPMTDQSLPGPQVEASWSSGQPTLATSGATFLDNPRWGSYDNTMAVAALKASRVVFFRFTADGRLIDQRTPPELTRFGRLRSVSKAANGDLLITTANGLADQVLRVSPPA